MRKSNLIPAYSTIIIAQPLLELSGTATGADVLLELPWPACIPELSANSTWMHKQWSAAHAKQVCYKNRNTIDLPIFQCVFNPYPFYCQWNVEACEVLCPSWTWPVHISGRSDLVLVQVKPVLIWVSPKVWSSHIVNGMLVWAFFIILLFIICFILLLYKSASAWRAEEIADQGILAVTVHGKISLQPPSCWCSNHLTIALIAVGALVPKAQTVALGCLTVLKSVASQSMRYS